MSYQLTDTRPYFKPFQYPWAYQFYKAQESMHWTVEETPIAEDLNDWDNKIDQGTKEVYTHILNWFTQQDINVASGYYDQILRWYKAPEMRMAYGLIARIEGLHVDAYSLIPDQLGLPESEYKRFLEIESIAAKHEFFTQYHMDDSPKSRAFFLARNGVLGEGLSLYGLFVILMNAQRFGKMKNLGQIVTWSARDENLHVEMNLKTFNTELEENPEILADPDFKPSLVRMIKDVVKMEKEFLKEAFSVGKLPDLKMKQVFKFIQYLADFRAVQLGLEPIYGVEDNPLEWMDWIFSNNELTNFFENRATGYAAGMLEGDWVYPEQDWWFDADPALGLSMIE